MSAWLCALLLLLLAALLVPSANAGFNRDVCYADVLDMLKDGSLLTNDTVFYRDELGRVRSELDNPILTLPGCNSLCGSKFGWYRDSGPRLSTWLIPVVLLLSNVEVSPLDKRRYLMLVHLLGDPIDSFWSMLLKMEAWGRCYDLAEKIIHPLDRRRIRNLATVLGGMEELVGFHASPLTVYTNIISSSMVDEEQLRSIIGQTAEDLADSRTDERLRTVLAAILYFFQVVSAFIATVGGGNTTPPGGRIGTAMLITWIIPAILLSNAIGGFTSRRTCFNIIERFVSNVNPATDLWTELQRVVPHLHLYSDVDAFFNAQSWSGALYSYRPGKRLAFGGSRHDHNTVTLCLLSILPIVISSITASLIIWDTPPVALNCRNFMVLCITSVLLLSPFLTYFSSCLSLSAASRWHWTIIKDTAIAVPSIILIFLSSCGLFNSCRCWSGVYGLHSRAHVPLNPVPEFVYDDRTIYPTLVGICLVLQVSVFIAMMWIGWKGWCVMRWSEAEKRQEWMSASRAMHRCSISTLETKGS